MADIVAALRAAGCVFAEDEARVLRATASTPDELSSMLRRRLDGEPLEHVVGWVDFCGLRIAVTRGVFVPRRRSELLVRLCLDRLPATGAAVVVELCCGAGAIGAAVGAARPATVVHAVDVDPVAVGCARTNLAPCGGSVYLGDLYDALPCELRGRVDVIVANAPYVPSDQIALMPAEARLHEPRAALDGGPDGLDVQRRIAAGAREWLAPGGIVVIETSRGQADGTEKLLRHNGFTTHAACNADLAATAAVGRS